MGCSNSKEEPTKPPTNNPIASNNTNSLSNLKMPTPTTSATSTSSASATPSTAPVTRAAKLRLSKSEVESRIVSSETIKTKVQANIPIQYAWVSQRGFYPNALDKPNQDSYIVVPNFGENMALFAVFDGHGIEGHTCAWFVRDHLPKAMQEELQNFPNTQSGISKALTKAHVSVNKMLHDASDINDELSGTTSISVLMIGRTLYVCNVGDSRAIILSKNNQINGKLSVSADVALKVGDKQRLLANPLSSDQTPYRKDERERVMRRGARVLTQDQIDGVKPITDTFDDLTLGDAIDEDGDPPRVWSTQGNYPGTAFTRSFGDSVAETIGVFAEPEILTRELNTADQYIIIASDGVFEFITNQMVSDMVALYSDNPLTACKIVVSAAYELWLQYETRTDDITIIVIYVGDRVTENSTTNTNNDDDVIAVVKRSSAVNVISEEQIMTREARPVRRGLSREKKKKVITSVGSHSLDSGSETDAEFNPSNVERTKTPGETEIIINSLQHNFLFQKLSRDILEAVAHAMTIVNVTSGQKVIVQGDEGDKFYVVCSGTYEVKVRQPEVQSGDGEMVATYEAGKDLHPCFGDLALMYGQPRAATVIAVSDGSLWALDRNVFRAVMKKLTSVDPTREYTRALRKISLLRQLNLQQIQRLLELMTEVVIDKGEVIVRKGNVVDTLYLLIAGTCQDATESNNEDAFIPSGHVYEAYDYFGEYGLVREEPPRLFTTTIVAITDVAKLLTISRQLFEDNFGPLEEVIDIQIRRRESFSRGLPVASAATAKLDNNSLKGTVQVDSLGVLLVGHFASIAALAPPSPHNSAVNSTVRTFLLKEVEKNNLSLCVRNFMLVVRTIVAYCNTTRNSIPPIYWCLPKYHSVLRDSNAIHLLFKEALIGDIADVIHQLNEMQGEATSSTTIRCDEQLAAYITSSVVRAIEVLHGMGIIFRSVQPEAIHVSIDGKIMIIDYRQAKVGGVGTRTYTLCGATDYLAPEQITNAGYGAEVDLWACGVLLFELICGENPFHASSEVGVYQNIAAFGSPKFRSLRFSNNASMASCDLINALLVVDPAKRLGAGIARTSKQVLKKHEFFTSHNVDWDPATTHQSINPSNGMSLSPSNKDLASLGSASGISKQSSSHTLSSALNSSSASASAAMTTTYKGYYAAQAKLQATAQAIYSDLAVDGVDVDVVASFSVPYYGTRWDRDLEC